MSFMSLFKGPHLIEVALGRPDYNRNPTPLLSSYWIFLLVSLLAVITNTLHILLTDLTIDLAISSPFNM